MQAPIPVGGETPILLPNELLLQKFSSKSSGYRQSVIRLHQQRQRENLLQQQEKERLRLARGSDKDRFVASLKKGFKKMAGEPNGEASGAREMAMRNDGDTRRPHTRASTKASRPQPSAAARPASASSPSRFNLSLLKNLLPNFAPPEAAVSYLTNNTQTGAVWITTERLIFVPSKEGEKGFYVHIDNLDCMKVVCMAVCDVDYDYWSHPQLSKKPYFFVAYEGSNFLTVPFSTHARASSFLKLLSNIRFEHMVKSCLPPPYMSCIACGPGNANSNVSAALTACNELPAHAAHGAHDLISAADTDSGDSSSSLSSSSTVSSCRSSISISDLERIDSTCSQSSTASSCLCHDDWVYEDNVLPTYQDSEHALKLYLIARGLLKPEEPFERSSHAQASNILAQANAPPSNDMDETTEREPHYRRPIPPVSMEEVHYPLVWF